MLGAARAVRRTPTIRFHGANRHHLCPLTGKSAAVFRTNLLQPAAENEQVKTSTRALFGMDAHPIGMPSTRIEANDRRVMFGSPVDHRGWRKPAMLHLTPGC